MSHYLLVPGAGGRGADWDPVAADLRTRGHRAIAVDLPAAEETAGLETYADAIVAAGKDLDGTIVLVAHSLGTFSAPLACERLRVELLVLVNPMVPVPGESAGEWWAATGQSAAARHSAVRDGRPEHAGIRETFLHDVDPELADRMLAQGWPDQSDGPFGEPWPRPAWPSVPTRVVVSREDRLFPAAFQRDVVSRRLGLVPTELDGGHMVALSRPRELAALLHAAAE